MNQRISQTISLRQRREQSLKPQMIQSLKMLALPMLDLEIALKNEIIQNPLLEMTEEYEENNRDEEMANDNKELDNETQETWMRLKS